MNVVTLTARGSGGLDNSNACRAIRRTISAALLVTSIHVDPQGQPPPAHCGCQLALDLLADQDDVVDVVHIVCGTALLRRFASQTSGRAGGSCR